MRVENLTTYQDFVDNGRPYLPFISLTGNPVIVNISVNGHITGAKAKNRLIIETLTIYNRGQFAAFYVSCISCQGFRNRWVYFRGGKKVTYPALTWEEKRTVCKAFDRYMTRSGSPEHVCPPEKHWRKRLTVTTKLTLRESGVPF